MMMQILDAGGIPAMTDAVRGADKNNPKGYFEYEPVKQLGQGDSAWLDEARGRAVKIIAQLLPRLPKTHGYRVIFMLRDLDEIVASQQAMLARLERKGGSLPPERMRAVFEGQLHQVSQALRERGIPLLLVPHADCLQDPQAIAAKLQGFLGPSFDAASVTATVDPQLYRSKAGK
jgi:hypothetical protein